MSDRLYRSVTDSCRNLCLHRIQRFQSPIYAHDPLDSPLTEDFDHNITQYQSNTIQSLLALKRKRERGEGERN